MRIHGSRVCSAGAIGFELALLAAFVLHAVESVLFWSVLGGFMVVCAALTLGLTALRLVAPGFTDGWWDPY